MVTHYNSGGGTEVAPIKLKVFFSYSPKDEVHVQDLECHLANPKREGLFESWDHRRVSARDDSSREIDENLTGADVIILLLSADFIASDHCFYKEGEPALARHRAGDARVIAVIVRPMVWADSRFACLQVLPKDATPITEWKSRDAIWKDVAEGITLAMKDLHGEVERLGRLLAELPDGIAVEDLEKVFPSGRQAVTVLDRLEHGHWEGGRFRLQPLGQTYLARANTRVLDGSAVKAAKDDLDRAMEYYGNLGASEGVKVGEKKGGAGPMARLEPEALNLGAMICRGLRCNNREDKKRWIKIALALAAFAKFSGRASATFLESARDAAGETDDIRGQRECVRALGDIARERSTYQEAQLRYLDALHLYSYTDQLGATDCMVRLGDVVLAWAGYDDARGYYERALKYYRALSGKEAETGQADCELRLGRIELRLGKYDQASTHYDNALRIYDHLKNDLGRANCIRGQGNVALASKHLGPAREKYEAALVLYSEVGSSQGQGNCKKNLGDVSLALAKAHRSQAWTEHKLAVVQYNEALNIFRLLGDKQGEANCHQGLGRAALFEVEEEKDAAELERKKRRARECFLAALALYRETPDPYETGRTHRCLAELHGRADDERKKHVDAALDAWRQIQRWDLVTELEEDFRPTSAADATGPAS